MHFQRYDNTEAFKSDILPILLENEAENSLFISLILDSRAWCATDWLLATVTAEGSSALIALWVKPFNLLLFEPHGSRHGGCAELLAHEMRRIGCSPPGVLAERGLAQRFAEAFAAPGAGRLHASLTAMRLDKLAEYEKAPGACRTLEERDMFYTPYWEHAFSIDCRAHVFTIPENVERIRTRVGQGTHFIWEDGGIPVSQAVYGRDTPNGAVINWVYTPPHYRGQGYATSVVAELSSSLFSRGKSYCCLLADANNPAACALYRKLGYYDICNFADIRFDPGR